MLDLWRRKVNNYVAAGVIAVIVSGLVVYRYISAPQAVSENVPLVRTAVVGAGAASQNYTYSGEVRGRYERQLAFQVGGKIIGRNVELGSAVNQGDILMTVDAKDIEQTVNGTAAQVYSAESRLRLAQSNLDRFRQLYEEGVVGRMVYEQYANAYDLAVASLQQASAQHVQGVNQLDYSRLRADKPGVVSGIFAEAGQVVGAGQPVLTVVQDGEREVEISVPENRLEELRNGQRLKVTFWALPMVAVDGRVREVAPVADTVTRTYKVRISLLNPAPEIKLGMTASVTVVGSSSQTITVPLAAVYQNGAQPAVWVVNGDTLALRPIRTGPFGDGTVQVLEGLQPGERIVTAGVHKLRDGQQVAVGGDSL